MEEFATGLPLPSQLPSPNSHLPLRLEYRDHMVAQNGVRRHHLPVFRAPNPGNESQHSKRQQCVVPELPINQILQTLPRSFGERAVIVTNLYPLSESQI